MISFWLIIFGVALQLVGGWSYFVDTIKGKIKPNKVTWLLWSFAPFIAFFAQVKQGVGIQALSTFVVGFVPIVIFVASFFNKEAEWKIGKIDIACGVLSILGLIAWYITKVGNVAIFFSIMADFLACLPTLIKSFYEPESENDLVYLLGIVNAGMALITIPHISFAYYGFPLYLVIIEVVLVLLIRFKLGKKFHFRS